MEPTSLPGRDAALALLHEHTQGDGLRKHAYAVEAAMRAMARKYGQDEERWGLVGLLHDFDYERWPSPSTEGHPRKGSEILAARGYPEDVRQAILAHADYTGVPRTTLMDRALFAVDEISGFLVACALVQPDRRLAAVQVASVKKKLKSKGFARNVKREDIAAGAAELRLEPDLLIGECLAALVACPALQEL